MTTETNPTNTSNTNNTVPPATPAPQTSTSTATEGSPKRETTQAELDQQYAERATRAAAAATKKLLDKLGLTSEDEIDSLKSTIAKAREIETANLSAVERAEKLVEAEKKRADLLAQQLETTQTAHRAHIIDAALKAAVGVADPALLVLHLRTNHAEAVNALLSETGEIDDKKLAALLVTAKTEKPILFGAAQTPGIPSNARGTAPTPDARLKEQATRETRRQMKKNF